MSQVIRSLKILNLSYSLKLIKTPDFGGLPGLECLVLVGCLSLIKVCESIGYLERLVSLDVSGCISLKDIPCLPRSLISLQMCGCSNLGGLGQVKCLDSCSILPSLLVNISIPRCNLFDNSFPEDWSNLISLKFLDISSNHITSLPGCVKSLPSLEQLAASDCSHLQSILDLPKSITGLVISSNKSLEIVQLRPNPLDAFCIDECEKLLVVEGCFKLGSIKNVDRKVIRYLGLESISEYGFDQAYAENDSIKVSYEFGIFSAVVLGKTLPCFRYKQSGSWISFRVPSHPNGSRISGLSVCFMSTSYFDKLDFWCAEVNNITKDLVWQYTPTIKLRLKKALNDFNYVWLSVWRTGNLFEDGDEIVVSIRNDRRRQIVEECRVNLVYDDGNNDGDNDEAGEDKQEEMDDTRVVLFNHISWTDRMQVEISDYVNNGKTYYFRIGDPFPSNHYVDWWGLIKDRDISAETFVEI